MVEVKGCSNPGLSYTDHYKEAILELHDWAVNPVHYGLYDYSEFQRKAAAHISSDASEIRMIVPFLTKTGVLRESSLTRSGQKIKRINVDNNLFTNDGCLFVQFLRIELQSRRIDDDRIRKQVTKIFHDFGLLQFENLCHLGEPVYQDILNFLRHYATMDKNEFYILTTCRGDNTMHLLDRYIQQYRRNEIGEIIVVKHVNAFQYISRILCKIPDRTAVLNH